MRQPALKFEHLDGIRGLTATYVVLFHAAIGFPLGDPTTSTRVIGRFLALGHEAVGIFVVLSGYCLALPAARDPVKRLKRTTKEYLGRRAFRILPPYYAALALSAAAIALVPSLSTGSSGTIWDDSLPGLEAAPLIAHGLLIHNWVPEWTYQINGPLWSVASEWQLYFFLPLFLGIWRRLGPWALLATAAVCGYLPVLLVPAGASSANAWYLLLFAIGALAAGVSVAPGGVEARLRETVRWRGLAIGLCAVCAFGSIVLSPLWYRSKAITDPLIGVAAATVLIHLAQATRSGQRSRLKTFLASRPLAWLGSFSYSIYLIHLPVLAALHFSLEAYTRSPLLHLLTMLLLGTPLSFLAGKVFHAAVERHFCLPQTRQATAPH